eukprot:365350-Chlamydomonas_euryale.AAC.5
MGLKHAWYVDRQTPDDVVGVIATGRSLCQPLLVAQERADDRHEVSERLPAARLGRDDGSGAVDDLRDDHLLRVPARTSYHNGQSSMHGCMVAHLRVCVDRREL